MLEMKRMMLIRVLRPKPVDNILSTVRTRLLHTLKIESPEPILLSPPLVSLDIPDSWDHSLKQCDPLPTNSHSNEGSAMVIDGKLIAEQIKVRIGSEVRRMKESIKKVPGLAMIMVGQRWDSQTYVRNKIKACEEIGIKSVLTELPNNCSEDDIIGALSSFNQNPSIHGILVQLPLPEHLDKERIFSVLSLEKDVDGFHPINIGDLAMRGREPQFIPCTPKGCIELLIRSGVDIVGKKAVVIGRSNIVGLPTFLLLQDGFRVYHTGIHRKLTELANCTNVLDFRRHHATVSVIHALTPNPEEITREADIVVSATGVPNLVRGSWLKKGAIVLDVGTFPIEDPESELGYRLLGDVCFDEAVKVAGAITPVPGGVGPMTIAMLLSNTLDAAKKAYTFS